MNNITDEYGQKLILIDGHAVAFYSWFTSSLSCVIPGFMKMLQNVIADHGPAALVTVCDPPPPIFRHELYPPYKANRPVPPDEFLDEFWDLTQLLRDNGVPVYEEAGFEADDVLWTLAKQASRSGLRSLVNTCALDLLQISDENTLVEVFSQYWPGRLFDMESASTGSCPPTFLT